ncbi:MAG: carbon-nitrogen hydrolase family protein [Candidatus Solibacter usitatus]|nr:carbon-nitrogen hydrolase family protein [Candidatus Solibacter usitatus]
MAPFTVGCLLLSAAWLQAADANFLFAGLSITPEPWNKSANLAKLERYARDAAARGANVISTPEGFLEGYVGNDKRTPGLTADKYRKAGEELTGPMLTRVSKLARELKVYLLIGFAERREGKMYNTAVIFGPDGSVTSRYAKSHTAADEPFNTPGTEFKVAQTAYGRWGTLICFDRQLPETARTLALRGAQFLLVPSWGGYGEMNDQMMRVRAYENGVWLAFVHPKRCLIIDPRGKVVAKNEGEEDQIVLARIELRGDQRQFLLEQRRPELYGDIVKPVESKPRH